MYGYLDTLKKVKGICNIVPSELSIRLTRRGRNKVEDSYLNDHSPFIIRTSLNGNIILIWYTLEVPLVQILQ